MLALAGLIGACRVPTNQLLQLDRFEGCVLLLVAFLGWLVASFSRSYLRGEARETVFWRWFSVTLMGVTGFITSGHILLTGLAWMVTSLGVHRLLLLEPGRREAQIAAHKKFLVSRLADACFWTGGLLWLSITGDGTWSHIGDWLAGGQVDSSQVHLISLMLALAVILKTGQFPFHGWLVQVSETPTPVSALLHAGVLNLGAVLLYKIGPLLCSSVPAQLVLVGWGCLSAFCASLMTLKQTDIKGALATSTVAQMGFLLIECGCGAYSLALLHMVAHSVYKAHRFLRSGSSVQQYAQDRLWVRSQTPSLLVWAAACLLLFPGVGLAAIALGWIWVRSRKWWFGPMIALLNYSITQELAQLGLLHWSPGPWVCGLVGAWVSLQLACHLALAYRPQSRQVKRLNRLLVRLGAVDERLTELALTVWPVDLAPAARSPRTSRRSTPSLGGI